MYSLVLCVIFGAFLIALGGLLMFGAIAGLFVRGETVAHKLFGLIFLPLGAVFLGPGVVTLAQAVHGLRGSRPPNARWQRWARLLNRSRWDGLVECPRCAARRPARGLCPACGAANETR